MACIKRVSICPSSVLLAIIYHWIRGVKGAAVDYCITPFGVAIRHTGPLSHSLVLYFVMLSTLLQGPIKSIVFFQKFCFTHFILLELFFTFYSHFTIKDCVQAGVFLVYHMAFRAHVAFVHISTFPINIIVTEFAKQHTTGCTEVIQKLLSSVSQMTTSTQLCCLGMFVK